MLCLKNLKFFRMGKTISPLAEPCPWLEMSSGEY
jgi:hypothetical protein